MKQCVQVSGEKKAKSKKTKGVDIQTSDPPVGYMLMKFYDRSKKFNNSINTKKGFVLLRRFNKKRVFLCVFTVIEFSFKKTIP